MTKKIIQLTLLKLLEHSLTESILTKNESIAIGRLPMKSLK